MCECIQLAALKGSEMAALAGGQADAEALIALKDFMNRIGCETLCTEEIFPMDAAGYVLCDLFIAWLWSSFSVTSLQVFMERKWHFFVWLEASV